LSSAIAASTLTTASSSTIITLLSDFKLSIVLDLLPEGTKKSVRLGFAMLVH
jgi:hypothetical protein